MKITLALTVLATALALILAEDGFPKGANSVELLDTNFQTVGVANRDLGMTLTIAGLVLSAVGVTPMFDRKKTAYLRNVGATPLSVSVKRHRYNNWAKITVFNGSTEKIEKGGRFTSDDMMMFFGENSAYQFKISVGKCYDIWQAAGMNYLRPFAC